MSSSRAAKIKSFRLQAQIPPDDSEPEICPPGCKIWHDDGKWPGAAKKPAPTAIVSSAPKISPYKNYWVGLKWCDEEGKELPEVEPTKKRLEHHARMHGPVDVQAVADFFGVVVDIAEFKDPSVAVKAKKRKSRPVPKLTQAKVLVDRGVPWTEVEDHLNLNRYTSAKLKMELEESTGKSMDQLYADHEKSVRGVAEDLAV